MSVTEDLMEIAKRNLITHGHVEPVFFLLKDDEFVIPPQSMAMLDRIYERLSGEKLNLEDGKSQWVYMIGILAKATEANRVVMIWDAAFKTYDGPVSADKAKNDPTEKPLLYPKAMRTECIILNEVLVPSGEDKTVIVPYKGGEGEPVEFLNNSKLEQATKEGHYESRFTEIILEGYNKARSLV
jgi:hypothetical protein